MKERRFELVIMLLHSSEEDGFLRTVCIVAIDCEDAIRTFQNCRKEHAFGKSYDHCQLIDIRPLDEDESFSQDMMVVSKAVSMAGGEYHE